MNEALNYFDRDWRPIPVPLGSKNPGYTDWEKSRLSREEVERAFSIERNIGVLLGEPSGWLVDVDLDHPLAVQLAPNFLPPTGASFGRAGNPRSHWLYCSVGAETKKHKHPDEGMIVELRSTGLQSIFPGSVHESGEAIEWHEDGDPAQVDPEQLRAAVAALAAEVERQLGLAPKAPPAPPAPPTADTSAWKLVPPAERVRRARAYIDTMRPSISGQGGDDQLFEVACTLYRFAVEAPDDLTLIRKYNERSQPAWEDERLEYKLEQAKKQVTSDGQYGSKLASVVDHPPEPPPPLSQTPVNYKWMTAAELDAANLTVEYLIEGLLAAVQTMIVAGARKTLKTSVLLDLAISLASGRPFLGKFPVLRRCNVALMSGESGARVLQETARRICTSKGLVLSNIQGLAVSTDLPKLESPEHHKAISNSLASTGASVFILDPAYLCMSGDDPANLFKTGAVLRTTDEICQEANATFILSHHTKKTIAGPNKPPQLEDIAWAGFQELPVNGCC